MRLSCTVNGEPRQADDVWEGESLLYVLRERLGLPGSKNACEQGECGSCSIYLDGVLVCACLVLAGQAEGSDIVTVEGLAADGELHPVQEAFVEAGAVQCGFCTPGLVVATHDLLARNPSPTDPEIREALAGNLCRCTGYEKVLAAVRLAAGRLGEGSREGVEPGPGSSSGGTETGPGASPGEAGAGPGNPSGGVGSGTGIPTGGVGKATGIRSGGVGTALGAASGRRLPSHPGAPRSGGRDEGRLETPEHRGGDAIRSETSVPEGRDRARRGAEEGGA
jgi:carbon-monoxide dehydrogenase small subunit